MFNQPSFCFPLPDLAASTGSGSDATGQMGAEGAESHCGCILLGTAQRRGLAGSHLLREPQHQALHTWQVPTTRQASGMAKRHGEAKAVHGCQ